MTQPAPQRALVDLDNIEFYRPQPLKSQRSESALLIPPILAPLSIPPGATARKTLPGDDGTLPFDHPCGRDSLRSPASLNTFDVELDKCTNAASPATSSNTVNELTQGQTGNETLDASSLSLASSPLASSPPLSGLPKTTYLPGPFGSTTSREGIEVSTEPDSHLCSPSPDLQERDRPRDIQPCGSHDEPSVSHGRCLNIPHHDNHSISMCGTPPSTHIAQTQNDVASKPLGERENDRVALGDGPLQLKENILMPALSQGDPLLNDQRLPSIGVVGSGPENQRHSDSGSSLSAESKKASVRQRSPMPRRQVAGVTPSPELPSTITKPPRRKSFEVAHARIVGGRNRPRRNCQPDVDVVQRDRHPDCSDQEESPRLTKRRKRAIRPVGTLTNRTSSGPSGKLRHSSASAQSAKSYGSQDIFGHAILTVETHALGTSYFFSFEPNSPNELNAPQFQFAHDEPRRLTAPSSTRGSKNIPRSKKGRCPSRNNIHTPVIFNPIEEREWEVEQILASRIWRGKLQYQAQWKGCDFDPTWYPARGFKGAPYKIQNFHGVFPDQPGPPKRLTEWLEGWEAGRELEDVPDDDLPE
ncbi:hypothetical protein ABOM_012139 [Aspergillus bombycis]|uniref:Chromo domain-containing protein n=1 Tax=Aspergillus bombycis TaxID=109264 RepID=A0A1F7ZIX3_9EURO|nr:hypothetical protein ABOM_012139 [Aspergillus bombycis]OGM39394.1 hypothetical protein ABOM_012139 [Aspergillus bombycis]